MRRVSSSRNNLPALLAAVAIVSILLAGCSLGGAASTHAPPTATAKAPATPSPSQPGAVLPPSFGGTLGPPPTDCSISHPPQSMTVTNFGGGFPGTVTFDGAHPAWELGMGKDGVVSMTGSPYPSTKIMWVVGPNYAQPVTLTGHDLRTGAAMWFDVYRNNSGAGSDQYGASAVLDPAAPNRGSTDNSTGHWNIWGIGMFAPAAGCYRLDVTSAAGSWHTDFAAGSGS